MTAVRWSALLLATMVCAPQSAGAQALSPEPAVALTQFTAPTMPMLLSRTLSRALPDGKAFTVTRRYRIRFVPNADGFRIDGELIAVEVDAPAKLAAFADLERTRPDIGMFPLHLDSRGMLLPAVASPSGDEVRQAIGLVLDGMGHSQSPALDMLEAQAFVQRFRQRPPASQWPADIFRPLAESSNRSSEVPLPGGAMGRITIEIAARRNPADGLMREMSRTITTSLDGGLRHSYESWTLAPTRP